MNMATPTRPFAYLLIASLIAGYLPTAGAQKAEPVKRALLIGISSYARSNQETDWWDLNSSRDVEALKSVLISKFGFAEPGIETLSAKEQTTRKALTEGFTRLIDRTQPGDIVYIHYSGHGGQAPDENGDEADGLDETLIPSDYATRQDHSKDIRDDELGEWLERLKAKRPGAVTVSFDCCFSGTNTRGGQRLIRGEAYRGKRPTSKGEAQKESESGLLAAGQAATNGIIVISATRSDQTAKETVDDTQQPMGLLTYALTKSLAEAGPQTSYRDVFERVDELSMRTVRDQNPQIEGDIDKLVMGGSARPNARFVLVDADTHSNTLSLRAGFLQGMTKNSRFAIYARETKDFRASEPLAEAVISEADLTTSTLALTPEFADKVSLENLQNGRAVEKTRAYGDNRLKVFADKLADALNGPALLEAVKNLPLVSLNLQPTEPYDVRIAPALGGGLRIERADGSIIRSIPDDNTAVEQLREALNGESRWRFIQALENIDPESLVKIEMRLVPVEVEKDAKGRVRKVLKDLPVPTVSGRTEFTEGDYVMIELRNPGALDAYVSVLNLLSDGTVGPLYPHPRVRVHDNKVAADGKWHRIGYPFVFKIEGPFGRETFRAIATREPADFSPLLDREHVIERERGEDPVKAKSPLAKLLLAATMGRRASLGEVVPTDWATATVSFEVVPSKPSP